MGEPEDLVTNSSGEHISVLLAEVLEGLVLRAGGRYIDCTVGGAGHAAAILAASAPTGRLLGLDRDPAAAARAASRLTRFGERARVVHSSYAQLTAVARAAGFSSVDGILFDLGFSSFQIDDPERGFAFRFDGPLDMRYDPSSMDPTAADLINQSTEDELVAILWQYGEERQSRRIARALMCARPIHTTVGLAEVVSLAVGGRRGRRLHPATRTFQALRIAVNQELELLSAVLPQALALLRPGGRLVVIAFHSLEDRIVKRFFKRESQDCICPPELPVCRCEHRASLRWVGSQPVQATEVEIESNPRSRSAKLRVVEKIA